MAFPYGSAKREGRVGIILPDREINALREYAPARPPEAGRQAGYGWRLASWYSTFAWSGVSPAVVSWSQWRLKASTAAAESRVS